MTAKLIVLPRWQVVMVLVGVPSLYIANSLAPWSVGLLGRHDHAYFLPFWSSIAVLHWGSLALVVVLLKRAGGRLADIGADLSPLNVGVMVGIPLVFGLALIALREASGASQALSSNPQAPATMNERLFWIFSSLTAGVCEELIYRGFGIRMLQRRNVRTWLAVGIATLAFFFMHGPAVVLVDWGTTLSSFLVIYSFGLAFSALFLWRRSVVPGICLHALIDLAN